MNTMSGENTFDKAELIRAKYGHSFNQTTSVHRTYFFYNESSEKLCFQWLIIPQKQNSFFCFVFLYEKIKYDGTDDVCMYYGCWGQKAQPWICSACTVRAVKPILLFDPNAWQTHLHTQTHILQPHLWFPKATILT